MALSDYLCGVLMGEMPGSFPLEALKAQAVAARTYTLQRLEAGGALSDDPAECQAFCDPDQAGTKYGEQADAVMEKLRRAVEETDGQVMIYDGTLITATYFSCSGGRTESAQAVWGSSVPYLLSVDSPGEEDADSFESRMELTRSELMERLEIPDTEIREITYTEGGGVETMTIGGRSFSGVELRQRLGLRSTNFQIDISGDTVTVDVKGFGHRVGMSQYGAKAMAERGQSYREILAWIFSDESARNSSRGEQAQDKGQDHERNGDPLGGLGQLGVPGVGLVLGKEAVRSTGDGAGKAGILAGLQQDHAGQKQCGEHLNNGQNCPKHSILHLAALRRCGSRNIFMWCAFPHSYDIYYHVSR